MNDEMRSTERQVVRARKIENSSIEQFIGDKYVVNLSQTTRHPIYLTYADSDVQALYLSGAPGEASRYAAALNEAIRLLICFKPRGTPMLISPSSIIQSQISRSVLLPFLQGLPVDQQHLLLLRREASWDEYFEKRQENTSALRKHEAFSGYFDPVAMQEISVLDASRKKFFSGADTIRKWSARVRLSLPSQRAQTSSLAEAAAEALGSRAFVFETAMDTLGQLGISLRPNDARALLIDAYQSSVAKDCAVPTAIRLPWDPCPAVSGRPAYSLLELSHLARVNEFEDVLMRGTPSDVFALAGSPAMDAVRVRLAVSSHSWKRSANE